MSAQSLMKRLSNKLYKKIDIVFILFLAKQLHRTAPKATKNCEKIIL